MKIKTGTIVRTVVLILTLVNTVLSGMGKNPLPWSEDEMYNGISAIATAIAALWSWWKNNSFTQAAIMADDFMVDVKNGIITEKSGNRGNKG